MVVLARSSTRFAACQLIVVLEVVVIELWSDLPRLVWVVQVEVDRCHGVVGLLILVVELGAVECVGSVALLGISHLCVDIEALVAAQVDLSEGLSFLKVAVLRATIRALVATAGRVGVCPLACGE